MKKMSLQWRLTIITTLLIAIICGCLTLLLYKNGIYYIDSLQDTVNSQSTNSDELYIDIADDEWDDFAAKFSMKVYDSKEDYRKRSLLITVFIAMFGGAVTYFISGRALKPLRDFSKSVEKVQAQNLTDCTIESGTVPELDRLSVSYNKMLLRLSEAFEVQRQFTGNAAHEIRTPLALMQAQLDIYNSTEHPASDEQTKETIKMMTEQNERLSKLVRTLLDMSELQTVARKDEIELNSLIEEVLADLEPLAQEKEVKLVEESEELVMTGSDILIYRMIYNLVENAIKYNHVGGKVLVKAAQKDTDIVIEIEDTGNGISEEFRERVFEPFFCQ